MLVMMWGIVLLTVLVNCYASYPITSMTMVVGPDSACPEGTTRMSDPLGSPGLWPGPLVYLCLGRDPAKPHITSLTFIESVWQRRVARCPPGWERIGAVNRRRFSYWLLLCVSYDSPDQHGIEDLSVVTGGDPCPHGFTQMSQNLNAGWITSTSAFLCVAGSLAAPPAMMRLAIINQTAVSVSWTTWRGLTSSALYNPVVVFGNGTGRHDEKVAGTTRSYSSDYHHDVVIAGLKPNGRYFYRCGDEGRGLSIEASFEMPPDGNAPFTAVVVGDMGTDNSQSTLKRMLERRDSSSFFMHVGDLAYADDRDHIGSNPDFEVIWNDWQAAITPIASVKPYMVLPGNHDVSCHSFGDIWCHKSMTNFTVFNTRFRMPSLESGGVLNLWYSFDYGPAHFIAINTESDYEGAPTTPRTVIGNRGGGFGNQIAWLRKDLERAAANRKARPWIIVMGHRPLYSSHVNDFPRRQQEKTRATFEGLFLEFKVDLYLSGHVHSYERSYPVAKSQTLGAHYTNPAAPVYVVNGAAGNIEGHDPLPDDAPSWSAFRLSNKYGYGVLDIFNHTCLRWQFYSADSDLLEDAFSIVKTPIARVAAM
ncbi:Purple acid phosphatase [Plasmodiophora brassicae]